MAPPMVLVLCLVIASGGGPLERSRELERAGDVASAVTVLRSAVSAEPTWALGRLELGRLMLLHGEAPGEALFHLDVARTLAPENPRAHYFYALAASENGHHHEAQGALEVAVALRADVEDAAYRLGGLYFARGEYARAAEAYRQHVEVNPDDGAARLQWALALERSGRVHEAEQLLRALLARQAMRPLVTSALADLLEHRGKSAEASRLRAQLARPAPRMRPLKPSRR